MTWQEKRVILFLMTIALLGLGMNFLTKRASNIRIIDYVNQDMGKIDLNQAGKEVLIELPGIGNTLAQRIIDYRKQRGRFRDVEELKNIKGIGNDKYDAIKDYFAVKFY